MKYIELIVLLNILIHVSFIKLSNFIMKRKNNWILILLTSIVDGIYIVMYLLIPEEVESIKYLVIMFLAIIPFVNKRLSNTLFSSVIYLMFNFILGGFSGIVYNIVNHYIVVIFCLFTIYLVFASYALYKRYFIKEKRLLYEILINDNKQEYKFIGFCDTGNFLVTDENIPIVFLKNNYKIGKYFKDIEIKTVSIVKRIAIYKVESFQIKINNTYYKKDVFIAYSDINYDVMFGYILLGG